MTSRDPIPGAPELASELTRELERLRRRVRELEEALNGEAPGGEPSRVPRREERFAFDGEVQFTGDFNLLRGSGCNVSRHGVSFRVDERVQFPMCFELNGREVRRMASLVWIRPAEGGYQMGFEFDMPLADEELGKPG